MPWQQPIQFNSTKEYQKKKPWAEMLANTPIIHNHIHLWLQVIHKFQHWFELLDPDRDVNKNANGVFLKNEQFAIGGAPECKWAMIKSLVSALLLIWTYFVRLKSINLKSLTSFYVYYFPKTTVQYASLSQAWTKVKERRKFSRRKFGPLLLSFFSKGWIWMFWDLIIILPKLSGCTNVFCRFYFAQYESYYMTWCDLVVLKMPD